MSGMRMLHFLKELWKYIQIYQYYTMALKTFVTKFWIGYLQEWHKDWKNKVNT